MATVITAENMPAVLAQIVERQEQQNAQIAALTTLCTEQALQLEEQREQSRVQASALRATTAQLSRGVSNAVKGVNARGNGNASRGNDTARRGNGNGNAKDEAKGKSGNVEQLDERRSAGSGGVRAKADEDRAGKKEPPKEANPPKNDEPAPRKKAHRWT
jgi:hypothetical protein